MMFNCEIGMKIDSFTIDRSITTLKMIIIYLSCTTMIVESAAIYSREKKRHAYGYYLKNRQQSLKERAYDGALTIRDFIRNNNVNDEADVKHVDRKNRHTYTNKKPIMTRSFGRSFDRSDGLTRILSFPLSNEDNNRNRVINDFPPGDPAGDCLAGGVDAGVINGALKIGIGFGLAEGCGTTTEQPPKMVPIPIYVPRPIPVPVAVPQPYPVTIDRPVAIRVPQPIPFPSFNMGSMPMVRQPFPSELMTGKAWGYRSWK